MTHLKLTAAATLAVFALSAPAQAACNKAPCSGSKGKMANEWTVSKAAKPSGDSATKETVAGGGGGKVQMSDISLVKKPTTGAAKLKLGAIKGE